MRLGSLAAVVVLGLSVAAQGAKPKGQKTRRVKAGAPVQATPSPAPPPAAPAPPSAVQPAVVQRVKAAPMGGPVGTLLDQARSLYAALEYDKVIPYAQSVVDRADATIEERLEGSLLLGSCLAIVGNQVDAEKPFRLLLRGRPDFDMTPHTPPKILAVFRKVQVEERAIREQIRALERERTIKSLEFSGSHPTLGTGGQPVEFEYKVRDPQSAVAQLNVMYRRAGDAAYSSLALLQDESGRWRGELGAEWTTSDSGFTAQYYVVSLDRDGVPLIEIGAADKPMKLELSAGSFDNSPPFYKTVWFWALTGGALLAAGVTGWVAYDKATELPKGDLTIPVE